MSASRRRSTTRCSKSSTAGDVVTHCFNGKAGGSIMEDEDLFELAERCAGEGIRLDVGHGGASFSFKVAEAAIARGLLPFSISTDLHARSLDSPVWDLGTTMSKLLAVGMPFEEVIEAATLRPDVGDQSSDRKSPCARHARRIHGVPSRSKRAICASAIPWATRPCCAS